MKLVVVNVFVEPLLIRELAKRYHPKRMTIKVANGYILLDVSKDAIVECFDLDRSALTNINKNRLEVDYASKNKLYRGNIMPLYMKKMYKGSKSYLF